MIDVYFIQGDVKGYLRSCRATDSVTPDPLILQRMACEIASGLLYLHKHNYIHRSGSTSLWPFPWILILLDIFHPGRPALVSPGNNILVLPEYMSQTPASVILLLGENPSLNKHHQLFLVTLEENVRWHYRPPLSWKFANDRNYKRCKHCSTLSCSQWPGS